MLKFTTCVLVIVVLWGSATSEEKVDGEVGYCNYDGLKIKVGETVPAPIGKCQKYTCTEANPDSIFSLTCAEWRLAPGSKCHKSKIDLTKQYPDCCPHKVCDEE